MDVRQTQEGNEPKEPVSGRQRLLDLVRGKMRMLHLAKRTEEAYVGWIVDFLRYARVQAGRWIHPRQIGDRGKMF